MLFVVAGIPGDLFQRFQQLVTSIFGTGHLIVAKPVRARQDGRFVPTVDLARALISELASRSERNPDVLKDGCGVIILSSAQADVRPVVESFHPFALPVVVPLPMPTLTVGEAGRRTMNKIAANLRAAAIPLQRSVRSMTNELAARRNRTPLLLPHRNFASHILGQEIQALFDSLGRSANSHQRISSACERIEQSHPFRRRGGASFFDERGVRFKAPGRALHGKRTVVGEGHLPTCLLNSQLRLGGYSESSFHYDCTDGEEDRLEGQFPNCHGEDNDYVGRPHLNIYPNDFIR